MKRTAGLVIALLVIAAAQSFAAIAMDAVPRVVVNWERGIYFTAAETSVKTTGAKSDQKLISNAKTSLAALAVTAIVKALESTPVDSFRKGSDYLGSASTRKEMASFITSNCLKYSTAKSGKTTVVRVVAQVPIYKAFQLMMASQASPWAMEKSAKSAGFDPEPKVRVEVEAGGGEKSAAEEPSAPQVGPFTSLIVDTLGLNVQRAMSPKIRREDGSEVWGTVQVDPEVVLDSGIVAYTKSMEEARKNVRAGTNPLVVTAVGRAGGNFFCDAVVSNNDAAWILEENAKSHFCDELKVIFVIDPKP